MEIPLGYRFKPSDEEVISYYLAKKIAGEALPSNAIIERELYGSRSPWEIFNDNDPWITGSGDEAKKKYIYVFTSLKFKTEEGSQKTRTAGCGTWDGQTGSKPIFDKTGEKIGKWVMLSFVSHKEDVENVNRPHWIMHEFSLAGERVDSIKGTSNCNYVVCKITRDYSKSLRVELPSEDKKKNMKTLGKRKNPHEEKMTLEYSGADDQAHSDLTSSFNREAHPLLEKYNQITKEKEAEEYAFDRDGPADVFFSVEELLGTDDYNIYMSQLPVANQVPLEQDQRPYPNNNGSFDPTEYSLAGPEDAPWMDILADPSGPFYVDGLESVYIPPEMQNDTICLSRKQARYFYSEEDKAQMQNKKTRQEE